MSETPAKHKYHWLPNALTVSRMLLIPVLVWAMLIPFSDSLLGRDFFDPDLGGTTPLLWATFLAFGLFLFCIVTDFLDGYLARKWKITSDFGRMLDPIADKLLVAASLISICIILSGTWLVLIPALIIIGRDIFVSGIREHAANSNIILSPTKLAKWKTACEMLAILVFLIYLLFQDTNSFGGGWVLYPPLSETMPLSPGGPVYYAFLALLWLAAILSAYTGYHYFRSAMRQTNPITEFD